MMYPYVTLADGTEVVHSHLMGEEDNPEVKVHFERPAKYGFDSVTYLLPYYKQLERLGDFTDDEITRLKDFTTRNAHLFYRFAAEGGHGIA